MTTKTVTVCDFCGAEKREVNHWGTLRILEQGAKDQLILIPFTGEVFEHGYREQKDACGSKCIHLAVSRFLDHGTLEEAVRPANA